MKYVRRTIVIICLFSLFLLLANKYTTYNYKKKSDSLFKSMSSKYQTDPIIVNKYLKIDNSKLQIKKILLTKNGTYIRYTSKGFTPTPLNAVKIYDDKNRLYNALEACDGKVSKKCVDGIDKFEPLNNDVSFIILKLEWYDRIDEIKISLVQEGDN